MDAESMTVKAREVIVTAFEVATYRQHATVESWHVLAALLDTDGAGAAGWLRVVGADPVRLREEARRAIDRLPSAPGASVSSNADPGIAREAATAIDSAGKIAQELGEEYTSAAHLLAGLARAGGEVGDAMRRAGATAEVLVAAFREGRSDTAEAAYPNLETYGVDLTASARDDRHEPVIGRDDEIRRLIQLLCRRTPKAAVLVGEPGVGRSAIIRGLAQRIVTGDVPEALRDVRLFGLAPDAPLDLVHDELAGSAGRVIVVVRRLHPVVGALLAHPGLRVVTTATPDGYREHVERHPELAALLRPLPVGEPGIADTIAILRGLKERYETHHMVRIGDAALVAAATLADRYVTDRVLPDKAIDLVDEAAAQLRIEIDSGPAKIDQLRRLVDRWSLEEWALSRADGATSAERLAQVRRELADGREALTALTAQWEAELAAVRRHDELRDDLRSRREDAERAQRAGNLEEAAELVYHRIPALEREIAQLAPGERLLLKEEVGPDEIAAVLAASGIALDPD